MTNSRLNIGIIGAVVGIAVVAGGFAAWRLATAGGSEKPSGAATATNGAQTASSGNIYLSDTPFEDAAIATKDPADLTLWKNAQGARTLGTGGDTHENRNAYDINELTTSRRIIDINVSVRVKVLSLDGDTARVEILDGIDKGEQGFAEKSLLMKDGDDHTGLVPAY